MDSKKGQVILRKRTSGVAFLFLDSVGKANVLNSSMMREIADALEAVSNDSMVRALAIISGKPDTFCSGADLREIGRLLSKEDLCEMSRKGQVVFTRLSNLSKPTVVGVNGRCLGGGLELILACRRRVATNDHATVFALPEVRLGLIPGLGGTQRLPRLIGVQKAIELVLSGNELTSHEALKIGLVDELVESENLVDHLERVALSMVEDQKATDRFLAASLADLSDNEGYKCERLFAIAERSVRVKTKGCYPAPIRALEVMKVGLQNGLEVGSELESQAFGELAASAVSRNLRFVFFNSELARRSASQNVSNLSTGGVSKVGIIGTGLMGTTIAQAVALSGFDVFIKASKTERVKGALDSIRSSLQRLGQKNIVPPMELESAFSKIHPVQEFKELAQADLIIEAVLEDANLKADIFAQLSSFVRTDCIFATNTSSLSIEQIACEIKDKERFVGLHFFHPVDKMSLVEVVSHGHTKSDTIAKAMAFVSHLNKIPVAVADSPCFLVNRLLCRYLLQAAHLAEQGIPLNWIEEAALEFGMPVGPLALLDEVGLDIAFKVSHALHKAFSDRLRLPSIIDKVEGLGLAGKSSGVGIYLWDDSGKRLSFNPQLTRGLGLVETQERLGKAESARLSNCLIMPMIDEAARCLEEKVVRRAREIDLAMVMGIGFPAFRGGLLKHADSLGIDEVVRQLEQIGDNGFSLLKVSEYLQAMRMSGRKFYGLSLNAEE